MFCESASENMRGGARGGGALGRDFLITFDGESSISSLQLQVVATKRSITDPIVIAHDAINNTRSLGDMDTIVRRKARDLDRIQSESAGKGQSYSEVSKTSVFA